MKNSDNVRWTSHNFHNLILLAYAATSIAVMPESSRQKKLYTIITATCGGLVGLFTLILFLMRILGVDTQDRQKLWKYFGHLV